MSRALRGSEAESELTAAAEYFDRGMPERRAAAIIRLGDLHVREGRLEEADQLLKDSRRY